MTEGICIEVVDATPEHIRLLAADMKEEDAETTILLGSTPYKALWKAYRTSLFKKAAFINGKIAAMWGVAGTYLGEKGYPWLLMSHAADEYPFRVAFCYRQELKKMLELFPVLEDWVHVGNTKSLRMLELMGFKMSSPQPLGKDGAMLVRAEKRATI